MEDILIKLGLEESEAKVYMALLSLGPSTVSEITRSAGITRTLGYHVLEKLGWYGLVHEAKTKGKKRMYSAEHPRQLVRFVKGKERSWKNRAQQVEDLLPEMVSLYKLGDKPVIKFQEGSAGVKSLFEESLTASSNILSIMDVESWQGEAFWDWAKTYNRERNKRKIKEQILILDTPAGREWISHYKGSRTYTQYRWVDPDDISHLFEFGGELNVYDNNVMIALLKHPKNMGILIESSVLANILRAMFQVAWRHAEPVEFPK